MKKSLVWINGKKTLLERSQSLDDRYETLEKQEKEMGGIKEKLKELKERAIAKLEKIAGMTKEEGKKMIITELENDLKEMSAKKIREAVMNIEAQVDDKAKDMLVDAMQRSATDYVAETTSYNFRD